MRGRNGESLEPLTWACRGAAERRAAAHRSRPALGDSPAAFLCVGWRFAHEFRPMRLPGPFAKAGVMVLLLVAVLAQFKTVNGLSAGTALLVVMGSLKLLETHSLRDRQVVIGVSLFLLLAACLDRQSLHASAALPRSTHGSAVRRWASLTRGNVGVSNRATALLAARRLLLALPLALVLLPVLPAHGGRVLDAAAIGRRHHRPRATQMSPGSISSLGESDEPAFRVHFESDAPPPEERYWRGPVLHDFDGYTWRQTPGQYYWALAARVRRHRLQIQRHARTHIAALVVCARHRDGNTRSPARAPDVRPAAAGERSGDASSSPTTRFPTRRRARRAAAPLIARRVDTRLPPNRNLPLRGAGERDARRQVRLDRQYIASVLDLFRQRRLRVHADAAAAESRFGRRLHLQHEARVLRALRFGVRHDDARGRRSIARGHGISGR